MNKEKEVEAYLRGELPEEEKIKYEIAEEMGILDKVLESGWKSLSAKEAGWIGCLMTGRRKENDSTLYKKFTKGIVWKLFRAVLFCVILKGNYNGITTGRG